MAIKEVISQLRESLPNHVQLIAISKTHPAEMIAEAYEAGQRAFGENRPKEMKEKYEALPKDIEWHMIGHLQTNKIKYIAPFVKLVHSIDSDNLLACIDKEAAKHNRVIDVLLEVHLAREESKSGWSADELDTYIASGKFKEYKNIRLRGMMTVGSLTDNMNIVEQEFRTLKQMQERYRDMIGEEFDTVSMGMTSDYELAIECGSNMVRIGSMIFGARDYSK